MPLLQGYSSVEGLLNPAQQSTMMCGIMGWNKKDPALLPDSALHHITIQRSLLFGRNQHEQASEAWLAHPSNRACLLRHAWELHSYLQRHNQPSFPVCPTGRLGRIHIHLGTRGLWGVMKQVRSCLLLLLYYLLIDT